MVKVGAEDLEYQLSTRDVSASVCMLSEQRERYQCLVKSVQCWPRRLEDILFSIVDVAGANRNAWVEGNPWTQQAVNRLAWQVVHCHGSYR